MLKGHWSFKQLLIYSLSIQQKETGHVHGRHITV